MRTILKISLMILQLWGIQVAHAASCIRIMQPLKVDLAFPSVRQIEDSKTTSESEAENPLNSTVSAPPPEIDGQPITETQINENGDAVTTTPVPDTSINLSRGQIFSGEIEESGETVIINVNRQKYRVAKESIQNLKLTGCFEQPVCVIAKRDTIAFKSASKPQENPIRIAHNDKLNAIAMRTTAQKDRLYLVELNRDYFWVSARDIAAFTNKTCADLQNVILPDIPDEEPVQPVVPTTVVVMPDERYSLGFEVGYGMGYSAAAYSNFLTDIPDASNVGPLSNPIITEIEKGKGLYLGPLLEVGLSQSFKLKVGAHYQEKIFTYKGKENPTVAPNTLDSLPDVQGTVKNQAIVFSLSPAYEFGEKRNRMGVGIQARTTYYISPQSKLTYRVGTVFKANEVTVEAGPKGFATQALLNGYYQWRAKDKAPFRVRGTLETDGSIFNLGLAFFY